MLINISLTYLQKQAIVKSWSQGLISDALYFYTIEVIKTIPTPKRILFFLHVVTDSTIK